MVRRLSFFTYLDQAPSIQLDHARLYNFVHRRCPVWVAFEDLPGDQHEDRSDFQTRVWRLWISVA